MGKAENYFAVIKTRKVAERIKNTHQNTHEYTLHTSENADDPVNSTIQNTQDIETQSEIDLKPGSSTTVLCPCPYNKVSEIIRSVFELMK